MQRMHVKIKNETAERFITIGKGKASWNWKIEIKRK